MTKTLTGAKALELLERAIAEKGADYVYERPPSEDEACVYSTLDGAPSCGVGFVFKYFDEKLFANVVEHENAEGTFGIDSLPSSYPDLIPDHVEIDPMAISVLTEFQHNQDSGMPWGRALDYAAGRLSQISD